MAFLTELWLPIVVSAVAVFFVSFLCHMVLPNHKGEWEGLPNEGPVMDALRDAAPKRYMFPYGHMKDMKNPEFMEKMKRGPNGTIILWPGPVNMGRNLGLTFLINLIVSLLVGYVAYHAFVGGRPMFAESFRITATMAFAVYGLGSMPHGIWFRAFKIVPELIDAILYAATIGAVFGWLWPAT